MLGSTWNLSGCGRRGISLVVGDRRAHGQPLILRVHRDGFRPIHISPVCARSLNDGLGRRIPHKSLKDRLRLITKSQPTSSLTVRPFATSDPQSSSSSNPDPSEPELHESPYTLPNALTTARLLACPWLGYEIIQGEYAWATGILFACGVSDFLDGYLARHWGGTSVLGSILDPAADKALMTTLVVTLAYAGLLPIPLAALILGRDVALSISAFYFRFISLPKPRTLRRYFDPSIPSAEVKPTQISKINTALQLLLMGSTTISPLIPHDLATPLTSLQWIVAGTTIWSGFSYLGRSGVRILTK